MEKIRIWGDVIPYNTGKIKKDDMVIRKVPKPVAMITWFKDIFGKQIAKDRSGLDTFTWLDEIQAGKVSERYDDVPTLVPYLVKSDTAVIIAPGGGFCNQSREAEGYRIAEYLNNRGITAFVLEYRMNPYQAPVCYLDMQRAIRYVRYHAEEYGLKKDRIGAMGFSAGGYVTGASAILLGNKSVEEVIEEYQPYGAGGYSADETDGNQPIPAGGYQPDEVDQEDGRANFLGMIYPVVHFEGNPNMLAILAGKDFYDGTKRRELMHRYSLIDQLTADTVPQFLCFGDKDMITGHKAYGERLQSLQPASRVLEFYGAGHGFSLQMKQYAHWADEFVKWVKNLDAESCKAGQ